MVNRKVGKIAIFIMVLIGIILATGFASNDKSYALEEPAVEVSLSPSEIQTVAQTPAAEVTPEKLSVEALTCIIKSTSGYEIDLRIKNLGTEAATVTIYPPGRIVGLEPAQIKRVDILIPDGKRTLNLITDSGEKFEVLIPACLTRGSSGTTGIGIASLADDQITQVGTTPLQPTPSPTSTPGISIPEYPWIGFPVIAVLLLMLFFPKKR